jgi:hypothetical protein
MRFCFPLVLLLLISDIFSQNFTISGYIKDAETGEALIGAVISIPELQTGNVSNNYGFYSITLPESDSIIVVFSFIGYAPQIKKINTANNIELNILLQPGSLLDEVVIHSQPADKNVEDARMSVIDIPLQKYKARSNVTWCSVR